MERELCLIFLILCAILPRGIHGESKGTIKEDIHVRKKRIIDRSPHPIIINSIREIPYIVNIKMNGNVACAGTILSPVDILTAAHCFANFSAIFVVLSGSNLRDRGIPHNITRKLLYPGHVINDLALITIFPPIDLIHSPNRAIKLHPIGAPLNNVAIVSGWGCAHVTPTYHLEFPEKLGSMQVHVIGSKLCQNLHHLDAPRITEKNLCTLDMRRMKSSCYGDSGAPLVMNGQLVGVLSFSSRIPDAHVPDVFMRVYYPEYTHWIISNMHYAYHP